MNHVHQLRDPPATSLGVTVTVGMPVGVRVGRRPTSRRPVLTVVVTRVQTELITGKTTPSSMSLPRQDSLF